MTSNRPYRKGLDPEIALEELEKGKNGQFDPVIVDAMVRAYRSGRMDSKLQEYAKDDVSVACPFCSTYVPVPEGAEPESQFMCGVCHRRLRLMERNEAYYAELLPASEAPPSNHNHRAAGAGAEDTPGTDA
jgi:hypothetical protein